MTKEEFVRIRKKLDKTQKEISTLLGISIKTVESYEQGLRNIPANIERILYFLLFKVNMDKFTDSPLCWEEKECPEEDRKNCTAWIAKEGHFCWFITGKSCARQKSLSPGSPDSCFDCDFFKKKLEKI